MDNDTSEIDKLTERISKDPKSKLFVPLAEEYKKAGDIEMSIHVLTEGLKNNPGYATARSFLGKLLFEKGDLSGAQREFDEEVAKAIPDNLMAQRKLGDLYVLQGMEADALKHYKIALSLNPRDQETASLVADVEAGRDVKDRLVKQKPQPPEDALNREASPKAAPAQVAAKPQPPVAATSAEAPSWDAGDAEEAEEVLVVEPLDAVDSVSLENALSSENLGFPSEPDQEPELSPAEKESAFFFDHSEPLADQQSSEEEQEGEKAFPDFEVPRAAGEPDKQADDFTTDTLAELYISQGFFEKAVEIYERLFADNPGSQGLKNKLEKVKALAAEAAPGPETEAGTAAAPEAITAGSLTTDIPPPAMAPGFFDEDVAPPGQEVELSQPDEQWSLPAAASERAGKESLSEPVRQSPKQVDADYEPVEYVPPGVEPRQVTQGTAGETAEKTESMDAQKLPASGRKETIDRLENWLQHIMKEK